MKALAVGYEHAKTVLGLYWPGAYMYVVFVRRRLELEL